MVWQLLAKPLLKPLLMASRVLSKQKRKQELKLTEIKATQKLKKIKLQESCMGAKCC